MCSFKCLMVSIGICSWHDVISCMYWLRDIAYVWEWSSVGLSAYVWFRYGLDSVPDSVLFDVMIRVSCRLGWVIWVGWMAVRWGCFGFILRCFMLFYVVLYNFILWLFMFDVYLIGRVISVRFGGCVQRSAWGFVVRGWRSYPKRPKQTNRPKCKHTPTQTNRKTLHSSYVE